MPSGSRNLNACESKQNDYKRKILAKCSEIAIIFVLPVSFFDLAARRTCSTTDLKGLISLLFFFRDRISVISVPQN
jgi:hypothetical protein